MTSLDSKDLEKKLVEAGNKLLQLPSSVDEIFSLLDEVENCLSRVEQSPSQSMQIALYPSVKALITDELLRHPDADVKVAVASCISEITRITAPDAPYDDDQMKAILQLIVSSFENLSDKASRSYDKRTLILETVAKVRSFVVMLDLECDGLIVEMFQHFLKAIRDDHPDNVFSYMETIMTLVLEESENISLELISPILASVKRDNQEVPPIARKLAERVLENSAAKIKPYLIQAMKFLGFSVADYGKAISSIFSGTTGAVESNDRSACVEQSTEESNLARASADVAVQDPPTNDRLPETRDEGDHPTEDGSSNSVVRNGAMADRESSKEKKLEQGQARQTDQSVDANVTSNNKPDDSNGGKIIKSDSKTKVTSKKRRMKKSSNNSTDPADFSLVHSDKEAETTACHGKSLTKEVHRKHRIRPGKKATAGRTIEETTLSLEDKSKKCSGKKATAGRTTEEATLSLEDKSKKCSGKKATAGFTTDVMTPSLADKSKNEDGSTRDSEDNPLELCVRKVDARDNIGDGSSSKKEDRKRRIRGKSMSKNNLIRSSTKDDDKEIVSSPKPALNLAMVEDNLEDTPKTSSKRKRGPVKEKASDALEYGDNLIGLKVKIWWPEDLEFYHGAIVSFDPVRKRHKIVYTDGAEEVLNLEQEKWEVVGPDTVSDTEQATECRNPDPSNEMRSSQRKRKSSGRMMSLDNKDLEKKLLEAGNKLLQLPASVDEILSLLDQVENCLSRVEHSPSQSIQTALSPSMKALITDELLRHQDADVKVAVASCISEITRITVPDVPYDDDQMKAIFQLIVSSFENLSDKASRSYDKRTLILETVAKVKLCVVMLDLECDGLIVEMFQHFLKAIRDDHPDNVFSSMETIMTLVLKESENISLELISPILAGVKRDNQEVPPIARKLAERVVENSAAKIKPYVIQATKSLGFSVADYGKAISSIFSGTTGAVGCNDPSACVEQSIEESNLARASSDVAVQDESVPESPDEGDHPVDANVTSNNKPDDSNGGKIIKSDSKNKETSKKRRRKKSSNNSADPTESSRVHSDKEAETTACHGKSLTKEDKSKKCSGKKATAGRTIEETTLSLEDKSKKCSGKKATAGLTTDVMTLALTDRSKNDDKEMVSSPKPALNLGKVEDNVEDTPKTSSKRKRRPVKAKPFTTTDSQFQTRTEQETRKKTRKDNYSNEEDIALVRAWLHISEDSVVGKDQKTARLWEQILGKFHQFLGTTTERNGQGLQKRWQLMSHDVSKFCGHYNKIAKLNPSGWNDQMKIAEARKQFGEIEGSLQTKPVRFFRFKFEHCWRLLKDTPKWNDHLLVRNINKAPKIPNVVDNFCATPSSTPTTPGSTFVNGDVSPVSGSTAIRPEAKREKEGKDDELALYLKSIDDTLKESAIIEREKWEAKKRRAEEKALNREMKVMSQSMAGLTPEQQAYWKLQQSKVIQRYKENGLILGPNIESEEVRVSLL